MFFRKKFIHHKTFNLVHTTLNKIRERILQIPDLFFLKRDLTGSMGLLRHYQTDIVNTVLDEFINYEFLRQGRKFQSKTKKK